MRASLFFVCVIAIATPSKCLLAQSKPQASVAAAKAAAVKPVNRLPHKIIYPGDLFYHDTLAKTGAQGVGVSRSACPKNTRQVPPKSWSAASRPNLIKAPLLSSRPGHYELPDSDLKYFEGIYSLNIIFHKDSVLTINNKTCADFNTDLAYFRSARSGESVVNLGAFELIGGITTVQLIKNQGADGTLKYVKAIDSINADTIAGCAKKPGELFVKTYVNAAKKRGVKF